MAKEMSLMDEEGPQWSTTGALLKKQKHIVLAHHLKIHLKMCE